MTISPRCLRQTKQSTCRVFISLISYQYFRWRYRVGCQLFKSSNQAVIRCVIVKYLFEIVSMPAYHVKIPACMFLVVPAVARSHDPQLFLVESWRQDEWLEIAISQNTDTPFGMHAVLQRLESCIAAGTFNTGIIS